MYLPRSRAQPRLISVVYVRISVSAFSATHEKWLAKEKKQHQQTHRIQYKKWAIHVGKGPCRALIVVWPSAGTLQNMLEWFIIFAAKYCFFADTSGLSCCPRRVGVTELMPRQMSWQFWRVGRAIICFWHFPHFCIPLFRSAEQRHLWPYLNFKCLLMKRWKWSGKRERDEWEIKKKRETKAQQVSYERVEDHLASKPRKIYMPESWSYIRIHSTSPPPPTRALSPRIAIYKAHANIKSPLPSHTLATVRDVCIFSHLYEEATRNITYTYYVYAANGSAASHTPLPLPFALTLSLSRPVCLQTRTTF